MTADAERERGACKELPMLNRPTSLAWQVALPSAKRLRFCPRRLLPLHAQEPFDS
jgi:hypothetical protein